MEVTDRRRMRGGGGIESEGRKGAFQMSTRFRREPELSQFAYESAGDFTQSLAMGLLQHLPRVAFETVALAALVPAAAPIDPEIGGIERVHVWLGVPRNA
jgi:hypothetical protein